MDIERKFNDLNIDAITGVRLLELLDLSADELALPQRFNQFKDVISYLKQFPEDTQRFIVNKSTRSKAVDKLSHIFEYINILKEKEYTEGLFENTKKEKSVLETSTDEFEKQEVEDRYKELETKINTLKDELFLYEK